MRQQSLLSVPAAELISPDFVAFTRELVARDGVYDVYLQRSAGPVLVSGGEFGEQTIDAQAMDADLEAFLVRSLEALDRDLDLDLRLVADPQQADLRFYLDSTIELGDGGVTLGLALQNPRPEGGFWEVIINTPEFSGQPDYLRYASNHELGHTLGLEHPFDPSDGDVFLSSNPYRSAYPEESLMAYRRPLEDRWPEAFTRSDRAALQSIWGVERPAPANRLLGTVAPDRLTGTPDDDQLLGLAGPDQLRGGAGSNWYASPADGATDWIVISPDGSRRPARAARSIDVITEIGREDRIAILGVSTRRLRFSALELESPAYGRLEGVAISANGRPEALYIGDDLSLRQLRQLSLGLPTDTLA